MSCKNNIGHRNAAHVLKSSFLWPNNNCNAKIKVKKLQNLLKQMYK